MLARGGGEGGEGGYKIDFEILLVSLFANTCSCGSIRD